MGFQTQVNREPGVAQAGDFADANIRSVVLAGPGGFIAAALPRGPIVGNFAWGDQRDAGVVTGQQAFSNYRGEAAAEIGFVHRETQAIIVNYLDEAVRYIQPGLIVTLYNTGGFWAKFLAGATPGQKVFANYLDGSVYAAAAGTSTQTAAVTASLAPSGVLTVTAVGSGALAVGNVLANAGGTLPDGTAILSQLSGAIGGIGTYQTSGLGATIGGGAVTANGSVETAYYVDSPALAGEHAKITTWG